MKKTTELELADLVEKFLDGIDEEMEHGCYSAPEGIPYEFEDEENYYDNHEKIVYNNVKIRSKIEKLLKKIHKNTK